MTFLFAGSVPPAVRRQISRIAQNLPEGDGLPIRIEFHDENDPVLKPFGGSIHAGALLRERRIIFGRELMREPLEISRIFVHEISHFAWLRLGNARRFQFEELLKREHAAGELGWSAEWRKAELTVRDRRLRTRRWREYVCESFCDTAAFLLAGLRRHDEFTLNRRERIRRRRWFEQAGIMRRMPV